MTKLHLAINPKAQWSVIKSIINPDNYDTNIRKVILDKLIITDPSEIYELFQLIFC